MVELGNALRVTNFTISSNKLLICILIRNQFFVHHCSQLVVCLADLS
jgi:hypothetical protein